VILRKGIRIGEAESSIVETTTSLKVTINFRLFFETSLSIPKILHPVLWMTKSGSIICLLVNGNLKLLTLCGLLTLLKLLTLCGLLEEKDLETAFISYTF
jgi:hypothetical protein